jgi:hypothetical protein
MNAPGRVRRNKLHKQEAIFHGETRSARQGSHSAGRVRPKTAPQETTNRAHNRHIVSMFASKMGTLNVHAQDGKGREMFEPRKRGCRPKKWQGEKEWMGCIPRAAQLSSVWSRPLPANTSSESRWFLATVSAAPSILHWQNRNLSGAQDTCAAQDILARLVFHSAGKSSNPPQSDPTRRSFWAARGPPDSKMRRQRSGKETEKKVPMRRRRWHMPQTPDTAATLNVQSAHEKQRQTRCRQKP